MSSAAIRFRDYVFLSVHALAGRADGDSMAQVTRAADRGRRTHLLLPPRVWALHAPDTRPGWADALAHTEGEDRLSYLLGPLRCRSELVEMTRFGWSEASRVRLRASAAASLNAKFPAAQEPSGSTYIVSPVKR